MTRWIMIAMTVIGVAMAFATKSPAVLGIALLLGFIGLFGIVMSIAADRISSGTRPETAMLQPEVIAAIRERARLQASASAARDNAPATARPDTAS